MSANKWEGEDEDEDVKVRGNVLLNPTYKYSLYFDVFAIYLCLLLCSIKFVLLSVDNVLNI